MCSCCWCDSNTREGEEEVQMNLSRLVESIKQTLERSKTVRLDQRIHFFRCQNH